MDAGFEAVDVVGRVVDSEERKCETLELNEGDGGEWDGAKEAYFTVKSGSTVSERVLEERLSSGWKKTSWFQFSTHWVRVRAFDREEEDILGGCLIDWGMVIFTVKLMKDTDVKMLCSQHFYTASTWHSGNACNLG